MALRVVRAPGRVNLIGDHTDYTGGLVLPMAIHLETIVEVDEIGGAVVHLTSDGEREPATIPVPFDGDPITVSPPWARYVAGVVAEARPERGARGRVRSTVPPGAGLSSSAALEVATALALGVEAPPVELAQLCRRAEHRAVGVPSGIMDQLTSAAGVEGKALVIDCHELIIEPVALPDDLDVVVVHSGERRALAGSAYAERVAQCAAAEAIVGPLRLADLPDVAEIRDPLVRARARHVVTENGRVRSFAAALAAGDAETAGHLMIESHVSLRDDYAVSTPTLDALVERLCALPGVLGARLTGAGFGGCVVALCTRAALPDAPERRQWLVRPAAGASVLSA